MRKQPKNRDAMLMKEDITKKKAAFESFWKKESPSLLLFAEPHLAEGQNYFEYDLVRQHESVDLLFKEAVIQKERFDRVIDDGLPVMRADLGTTLLPSGLGMPIQVQPNAHPWLDGHLRPEEYLGKDLNSFTVEGEIPLAIEFYRKVRQLDQKIEETIPYLPDTQGIFDLTHLVVGTDVFYLFFDRPELVEKLQKKSLELFLRATRFFKELLGEDITSMVHGHGMFRGVWFPDTGARISEDSCTLLSMKQINEFCLPYIRDALRPFGRGFMHYCGRHEDFLIAVCNEPLISTINLGNPEFYDLDEVMKLCGMTDTVFFGHLPKNEDEDSETFIERVAESVKKHCARAILIHREIPESRERMQSLLDLWHRLTK
jgi:hypothetical protein